MKSLGDYIRILTTLFLVLDIIGIIVGFVTLLTIKMFLIAIIVAVLGLCSALLFFFALYALADLHDRISYISSTSSSRPSKSSLLQSARKSTTVNTYNNAYTSKSSAPPIDYATYIRLKQELNEKNKH